MFDVTVQVARLGRCRVTYRDPRRIHSSTAVASFALYSADSERARSAHNRTFATELTVVRRWSDTDFLSGFEETQSGNNWGGSQIAAEKVLLAVEAISEELLQHPG